MPKNTKPATKPQDKAGKATGKPAAQNQGGSEATSNQPDDKANESTGSSARSQAQGGPTPSGSNEQDASAANGAARGTSGASTAKSTPGLAVTSNQDGFWRAGRQWTKGTTTVRLDELNEEQIQLLRDEPRFSVVDVDLPTEGV